MANIAKMLKDCRTAKDKAIQDGKVPRSWLATLKFCRLMGGKDELLGLPLLNTQIRGGLHAGKQTDIVLLCD